jgi:hypothetical protein
VRHGMREGARRTDHLEQLRREGASAIFRECDVAHLRSSQTRGVYVSGDKQSRLKMQAKCNNSASNRG